jgi:hypothetical protein
MRPINSQTLKVDAAASITDEDNGRVQYDWAAADVDTEGEFIAWFNITLLSGKEQDAPEFLVIIDSHAPGNGASQGEISFQTKQLMPSTWDRLSNDARYGDRLLQNRIDYVKYKLFATIVTPAAEATVYNPLLLDYAAKEVALQIIPAGIEYWMTQPESINTTGTSESAGYPDRIDALKRLQEWLLAEVRELRPLFPDTFTVRRKGRFPGVSNNDQGVITPNPSEFGEPFDEGIPKNLPWGPAF